MAVEKTKIKERLKVLFPGVNLSKERIEEISTRLATKPADDAEDEAIDAVINESNFYNPFADIAKGDDVLRTLKANQKPTPNPAPTPTPEPNPNPNPTDEAPEWAKALIQEVQTLKAEKQQSTILQQVEKHDKLKDVPKAYWEIAALPQKAEDVDTWAENIAAKHAAYKQAEINGTLGNGKVVRGTDAAGSNNSIKAEMEQFVKEKNNQPSKN